MSDARCDGEESCGARGRGLKGRGAIGRCSPVTACRMGLGWQRRESLALSNYER